MSFFGGWERETGVRPVRFLVAMARSALCRMEFFGPLSPQPTLRCSGVMGRAHAMLASEVLLLMTAVWVGLLPGRPGRFVHGLHGRPGSGLGL